jgi:hypothetical protein
MEIAAFISFAILVLAWLFAPTGETKPAPEAAASTTLQVGEATA